MRALPLNDENQDNKDETVVFGTTKEWTVEIRNLRIDGVELDNKDWVIFNVPYSTKLKLVDPVFHDISLKS